jgi:hypothetical protein
LSKISLEGNVSGSGTLTISAPNTNSNFTLSLPTNTGTIITTGSTFAGTGPAFSAYRGSNQSISANTYTKVEFGTEEFDTANCYDPSTNFRFTPNVAGYYQVNSGINIAAYSNRYTAFIYKNGSEVRVGFSNTGNGANDDSTGIWALIYLNGSTDYIEIYVQGNNAATVNGSTGTYFQAFLARAA